MLQVQEPKKQLKETDALEYLNQVTSFLSIFLSFPSLSFFFLPFRASYHASPQPVGARVQHRPCYCSTDLFFQPCGFAALMCFVGLFFFFFFLVLDLPGEAAVWQQPDDLQPLPGEFCYGLLAAWY